MALGSLAFSAAKKALLAAFIFSMSDDCRAIPSPEAKATPKDSTATAILVVSKPQDRFVVLIIALVILAAVVLAALLRATRKAWSGPPRNDRAGGPSKGGLLLAS
jgi:hypothetical protein